MAQTVVTFALERLGELLISEAKFLYGVREEIEAIQRELTRMQCFLEEADKRQIDDKGVRNWVAEVRELAFKTEDVIETFFLDVASNTKKSGFKEKLLRFARMFSEGVSLHKIGMEIKTIHGELSRLTTSLSTYGITNGWQQGTTLNSVVPRDRRIFHSHIIEKDFLGMEKEIEKLISHLTREDKLFEIVSICGMGGMGKTTVAKQLYNNDQVKAHFEASGWVCITQQLNMENVLKSILKQLLPAARDKEILRMDEQQMVCALHTVQKEKNCLVVVDDIWTVDAWRNLRSAFPIGETSCSKILLTTRDETVAGLGFVYKLPGFTEEEGWRLLSKKAFPETGNFPVKVVISKFESLGKQMVKRCKGLPLAISTLGGMLIHKKLREWKLVYKNIAFHLAKGDGLDEYLTVTYILGLSYKSLPPCLRHCFLCLSRYKEDEEILAEELYLFWIAESLILREDIGEGGTMLEVAEGYLGELANRNLVQVQKWGEKEKSWSKFKSCRVHDLIRDLCLLKVKEEKFIKVIDSECTPNCDSTASNYKIRRLCIHLNDDKDESRLDQYVIPELRCLSLFNNYRIDDLVKKIFRINKLKFLRVLTVKDARLSEENLRSIAELVYLKYLSFKGCILKELPSTIGNLRNLETLDLKKSRYENYGIISGIRIPNILWKLKQLKHLYLPEESRYVYVQRKLRLNGLNELELIEGFDSRYCETDDLIELSKIKVLSDTKIYIDEKNLFITERIVDFINSMELGFSSLFVLSPGGVGVSLKILLECCFIDYLDVDAPITAVPNGYEGNPLSDRLTYLCLSHSGLQEDPMVFLEKLSNLRHLYLKSQSYMGRGMVCSSMGFPQLQSLHLSELPNLTNWRVYENAMPSLSNLLIMDCAKLKMLPDGFEFLEALKDLDITNMPTEFTDRMRVKDGTIGLDIHKIRHVHTVRF